MKKQRPKSGYVLQRRHLLFVFVFVSLFAFMAYASSIQVDTRFPYHKLQNITDETGASVDGDRDGVIDNAELAVWATNATHASNAASIAGLVPDANALGKGCLVYAPGFGIGDSYTGWTQMSLLINNENICADYDGCKYTLVSTKNGNPSRLYHSGFYTLYQFPNALGADQWIDHDEKTGTNGDSTYTRFVNWKVNNNVLAEIEDDHAGTETNENAISVRDADTASTAYFIFCD